MKTPDPSQLTFVAIQAALLAGKILQKGFGTSFEISHKPGVQNLVTEYDMAAERCIIDLILEHFPDHRFLAEESGASSNSSSPVLWVIDPLDGTVNFAHNIPFFCVSIAATIQNKVASSVIYQPMTQELFVAEIGKGAYLNGKKLHVTDSDRFEKALLATGFPYNVSENPLHCIDLFSRLIGKGVPIRRFGSAALDLAYLAAGRFDAYWEVSLHPWDMAAGKLLVEEAGGRVTHYDGSIHTIFCHKNILATNGKIHQKMIEEIAKLPI